MPSQEALRRRAWLSERIGNGSSDASLVALAAATFKVSEKTIKKDLSWVYDRWMSIWEETQPAQVAKFMEMGLELLEECRDAGRKTASFGPAVQQFKTLAIMAGTMRDGLSPNRSSEPAQAGDTRPSDDVVRERIASLKNDPKVRERAMRAGLDLDKET
jgi:hypothetical protein